MLVLIYLFFIFLQTPDTTQVEQADLDESLEEADDSPGEITGNIDVPIVRS